MATIQQRFDEWATEEVRGGNQVNKKIWLTRYNKGLIAFQKMVLEYISGMQSTSVIFSDITKGQDEYDLPQYDPIHNIEDFYSILQLRVAYHNDNHGQPLYRVCKPINFGDYNIRPLKNYPEEGDVKVQGGMQIGEPIVRDRISELSPRYIFVPKKENGVYKSRIKIFPTPTEDVENGLTLTYNFIQQPIEYDQAFPTSGTSLDEASLNLPRYFFDAIDEYITFRLYKAENPEMAQWYYEQFKETLHDNIYGLNKDKRAIEESFANTTYFSHY